MILLLIVFSATAKPTVVSSHNMGGFSSNNNITHFHPVFYYPKNRQSKLVRLFPFSPEHRSNDADDSGFNLPASGESSSETNKAESEINNFNDFKPAKIIKSEAYTTKEIDSYEDKPYEKMKLRKKKEKKLKRKNESESSSKGKNAKKKGFSDGSYFEHDRKFHKRKGDKGKVGYVKESTYKVSKKKSYGRKFGDEKKKKNKKSSSHYYEPGFGQDEEEEDEEKNHEEKSSSKSAQKEPQAKKQSLDDKAAESQASDQSVNDKEASKQVRTAASRDEPPEK